VVRRFGVPIPTLVGLSCWFAACATPEAATGHLGEDSVSGTGGTAANAGTGTTGGSSAGIVGTATSGSSAGGSAAGSGATAGSAGSASAIAGAAGSGGGGGVAGSGGSSGANGNDMCPDDADKTAPGKCGCGSPDTDNINGASCIPLQNSLLHRYSFEVDAKDSVGSAHGTLMGGATISGGALTLAGADSGQFLDLPNGLVSPLASVTIEAFVTWTGSAGGDWQRVFDFGSSSMAEGTPGTGAKYLFLSARKLRACYTSATPPNEIFTDSNTDLSATATQLAVVVDGTAHTLTLFMDGDATGGAVPLSLPLSAINDVNNWLGRSQFAPDDFFAGKISEFRIYDVALTGPQLKTSKKMGENTTYLKKP